MKWKIAMIVCCYVIGAGFLAAWQIEAEKRLLNPPDGVLDLNPIMWMAKTGGVFLFIGTTVLTNLIVRPIGMFLWHRGKSDDRK